MQDSRVLPRLMLAVWLDGANWKDSSDAPRMHVVHALLPAAGSHAFEFPKLDQKPPSTPSPAIISSR